MPCIVSIDGLSCFQAKLFPKESKFIRFILQLKGELNETYRREPSSNNVENEC